MKYQHHIQLNTAEPLPVESSVLWYQTVKEYGPENITHTYMHDGTWVAMEYGIADGEEFPHQLIVPLERDLTPDETMFIVEAWTTMSGGADFDIEASNQYRAQGFGNFDNSLDIEEDLREQVIGDMGKFNHNRWVSNKVNEGWQWGSYFSSKNKTHPALKDWDNLPNSHRRIPDYTNTDIMEWLKQNKII